MDPKEIGENYDRIADWWVEQMEGSTYGLSALRSALEFVGIRGGALDVGCGGEGRFIGLLLEEGFECTGLDFSPRMIELARGHHPAAEYFVADICSWHMPRQYDLISAWDSIFHLPLESHEPVMKKLCAGLAENGVLLLTCGGGEEPGCVEGEFGGRKFEYSTLGVPAVVQLLWRSGCALCRLEYDQYPENHVAIIAKKTAC